MLIPPSTALLLEIEKKDGKKEGRKERRKEVGRASRNEGGLSRKEGKREGRKEER